MAVSHDRDFLDRIADRIVVVADGVAHAYEGGWTANLARVEGFGLATRREAFSL